MVGMGLPYFTDFSVYDGVLVHKMEFWVRSLEMWDLVASCSVQDTGVQNFHEWSGVDFLHSHSFFKLRSGLVMGMFVYTFVGGLDLHVCCCDSDRDSRGA